MKLQQNLCR